MARLACAFCPDLASDSPEHIFDDWLNRIQGRRIQKTYEFVETGKGGIETRRYQTTKINAKRPVVCARCNNGWMSDLTNHTKQTLEHAIRYAAPVTFIELGILTIAAFTFMKAVVLDHSRVGGKPTFLPSVRSRFRTDLVIPTGTQIWIAPFRGTDPSSGHTWHRTKLLRSGEFAGFNIYVFTYMVGYVALQMTFPAWTKPSRFRGNPPVLTQDHAWDGTALPVWPYSGPVTWPQRHYLGDAELEKFRDRFNRLSGLRKRRRAL